MVKDFYSGRDLYGKKEFKASLQIFVAETVSRLSNILSPSLLF